MNGVGHYEWRGLDGRLHTATNWAEIPESLEYLISFKPTWPPPPHTKAEHDYMATFNDKLHEVLARCRR